MTRYAYRLGLIICGWMCSCGDPSRRHLHGHAGKVSEGSPVVGHDLDRRVQLISDRLWQVQLSRKDLWRNCQNRCCQRGFPLLIVSQGAQGGIVWGVGNVQGTRFQRVREHKSGLARTRVGETRVGRESGGVGEDGDGGGDAGQYHPRPGSRVEG